MIEYLSISGLGVIAEASGTDPDLRQVRAR